MALKDWIKKGEDWYKEKGGFQELWMNVVKHKVSPPNRPTKIEKQYVVYHAYLGSATHPDPHYFRTKAEAHNFIMKKVRGK